MGFEVFLQCIGSEPPGIPRAAVRELFPIVEDSSERDYWSIRYDRVNSCNIGITASDSDKELIISLYVDRPCGDIRLWESVLAILRMGPVILYWPGGGPLVASELTADKIPREIVESLGQAKCVHSAQEFIDAIRAL
jgi:hypothetical protein